MKTRPLTFIEIVPVLPMGLLTLCGSVVITPQETAVGLMIGLLIGSLIVMLKDITRGT